MTSADPRSEKVAVVPEASLVELLPALRDAGYGVMQLPPADLDPNTAQEWLTQMVEQIAEYRRNHYDVVLSPNGAWCTELAVTLQQLGLDPLPAWP